MYIEARKIQLIEEVLKIKSEETISQLETVLKKAKMRATSKAANPSIYDFLGIMTKKEANAMRKAIEETSETINPDDWK